MLPQPSIRPAVGTSATDMPPVAHFNSPLNGQQFIDNQVAVRPSIVYMFPGGFDPQTFGNGPMMPWIYQQMVQASQQAKEAPSSAIGQPKRKREIYHGQKPVETTKDGKDLPGESAD